MIRITLDNSELGLLHEYRSVVCEVQNEDMQDFYKLIRKITIKKGGSAKVLDAFFDKAMENVAIDTVSSVILDAKFLLEE